MRFKLGRIWLLPLLLLLATLSWAAAPTRSTSPVEGFVQVNGARLAYLDWGGSGPALVFVPGLGDDPHVFADLAPAFTDHFRVIAYARRGTGNSALFGPYDNATSTRDLLGLLDALQIERADLAGSSAGGNEITALAADHPERIRRLIYLDAGYDGADPEFRQLLTGRPTLTRPASALTSFAAYRTYELAYKYPGLADPGRIEAYLRARVALNSDGSVTERTPPEVRKALYDALLAGTLRDYRRVKSPVLAIFASSYFPEGVADPDFRAAAVAFEPQWSAFREHMIARMLDNLQHPQIVHVRGGHGVFLVSSKDEVVRAMRRFLLTGPARPQR